MRSRNRKIKRKVKKNDDKRLNGFTRGLAIVYLLIAVVFEIEIIKLDVLPMQYLILLLVVLTPVSLVIFLILFFEGASKTKKLVTTVISFLLIITTLAGTGYATGTMSFLNAISSVGEVVTYETYNLIVPIECTAETIDDLDITEVGIYGIKNDNYSQARNELKKVMEIEYKSDVDLEALGNALVANTYGAILLSENNYVTLTESIDGYEDQTKVIYTIDIETIEEDTAKRIDVTEEPFNIYVTGIDVYGDINKVSRSDVNMVVTVNPKTHKILLTSIPRDTNVTLPSFGETDKLTHAGLYGVDESIGAIEDLLGIDINYYLKVNFSAVENLVDAIGGIEVDSDYAFTAKKGGYYYNKGINQLNGQEALSFARERYAFSEGDFQRIKNQQEVIEAIITKITSSTTLLMSYNDILGAVETNMDINMTPDDIKSLVKMQLDDMPSWKFEKFSIDEGSDALRTGHTYPYQNLYVFVPDENKVLEAEDKINEIMYEE